uniref:Small integral membrane protein 20 n=2 Tax=Elephantidae TaxID=9780 RepID=G5E6W4_LOXAF
WVARLRGEPGPGQGRHQNRARGNPAQQHLHSRHLRSPAQRTDRERGRRGVGPRPGPRPGNESQFSASERGHDPGASGDSASAGCSAGQGSPQPGTMSRILRTVLIFGGFVSLLGAAFYPIYFRPLMRLEEYQKEQAINRADIIQEEVQPPGLKVWSDPFGRK